MACGTYYTAGGDARAPRAPRSQGDAVKYTRVVLVVCWSGGEASKARLLPSTTTALPVTPMDGLRRLLHGGRGRPRAQGHPGYS